MLCVWPLWDQIDVQCISDMCTTDFRRGLALFAIICMEYYDQEPEGPLESQVERGSEGPLESQVEREALKDHWRAEPG